MAQFPVDAPKARVIGALGSLTSEWCVKAIIFRWSERIPMVAGHL
jgi:hypothetical protein